MFKNLVKLFLEDMEKRKNDNKFFIVNGYLESYAPEYKVVNDNGLKRYLTDLRYDQYVNGIITREKAIEYAVKRMSKQIEKQKAEGLARIERVEKAPELTFASIEIEWKKSSVWGYNPASELTTNNGRYNGYASGYGYDKESASVANAFNLDNTMLKILYSIKEKGLTEGLSDESKTACTGRDNRSIIGYGSGYSVLPYYEGGVGVGCFWSILKKAGYEVTGYHGKHTDFYRIEKIA